MSKGFCLEVSGDFACFTRPEMKVERVSYDVITPSAAPISKDDDLGWMLYDLDFSDPANIKPMFFRPEMKHGVIPIPHPESEEVRK